MKTLTKEQTAEFLTENDRFVILTHRRPDGDTLGSAALLCRGLRRLGKTAHILRNPEITAKYAHLHEGLTTQQVADTDILVAVDTASSGMLPEAFAQYADRIALRIDHHATAASFTERELVDPQAAACGELVAEVLMLMSTGHFDKPMANAFYTAISTDTGCFRYANTTAKTFEHAAYCAYCSDELFAINQALFDTNSLGRLRVQGYLVEHAIFMENGAIAICPLPKSVEEELGLVEDDLENISGFPRSIEGVKIAATLREDGNRIKISVRAVPGYDAAAICAKFGGGGHKGAAGASMTCTMDEAVAAIKEVMPKI